MRGILLLRLAIGLRNADQLQEADSMGVIVDPKLGGSFPKTIQNPTASDVAVVAQLTIHIVAVEHPVPGLQAATTGNPDRRMGLL